MSVKSLSRAIAEVKSVWGSIPSDKRVTITLALKEVKEYAKIITRETTPALRSALGNLCLMIAKEEFSPFGMGAENAIEQFIKEFGKEELEKCLS